MFDLLKRAKAKEADDHRHAMKRYAMLLAFGDSANEAEQIEILELLKALGKSTADLEADLHAVAERQRLQKLVDAEPQLEKQFRELWNQRNAKANEVEKEINRLKAELEAMTLETNRAETAYGGARRSIPKLTELNSKYWELFELPEPDGTTSFGPNSGVPYAPRTA